MKHCEQEMREVGSTGQTITGNNESGDLWGRTTSIYQCDKCKHIEIE